LLGDDREFAEELKKRGLLEDYQGLLGLFGGSPALGDDPLWLKKKYQEKAAFQEISPNLPTEVAAAGYAAMNNLDADDLSGRIAALTKEAQKLDTEDKIFSKALTDASLAFLAGSPQDVEKIKELQGRATTEFEKPFATRGWKYGRERAAGYFTGEIPARARQAVGLLRLAMGETTENLPWDIPEEAKGLDDVMEDLASWAINQSEDDLNKWQQAVKMLAESELVGAVEPGFWGRANQILNQPLAKSASAIGAANVQFQSKIAEGLELMTGDLVKKLPGWATSESLQKGADWWSFRQRMWNFLDQDIAPWVDMEEAGIVKKGLYAAYESAPFFAMAALGGPMGLASGGMMEAGMVDLELRQRYGDDIDPAARNAIALGTGAINAALERWAWKGTAWAGRSAGKNLINPVYQALRAKNMRAALTRAGVKGVAARATRGFGALAGATAIEFAEESVQDLTSAALSEVANVVVPDLMPEHSWREHIKEWNNHHGVRLFAVLPYAILGAGGRAYVQRSNIDELRGMLSDTEGLRESGVFTSEEELKEFAEEAKSDPVVAADNFQERYEEGTGETRNANRDNLTNSQARAQAEETGEIIVNQQATEGYQVIIPGQESIHANTIVEAQEVAALAQLAKDAGTLSKLPDLIKQHQEAKVAKEPDDLETATNRVEAERTEAIEEQAEAEKARRPMTVVDVLTGEERIAKPNEVTEERKKAWEAEHGLPFVGDVAILGATEIGLAPGPNLPHVRGGKAGVAHAVIKLYRGASPVTFTEEQAEGFLRVSLKNGDIELEDARQRLAALGRDLGMDFALDTTEGVIESFSELAVAYVSGSLTPEDLQRLPGKFANWLRKFAEFLANSLRMVRGLREYREMGELDSTLEGWVREAVGLNPLQAMEETVEEQVEQLEEDSAAQETPFQGYTLDEIIIPDDVREAIAEMAQAADERFMASDEIIMAQSEEEAQAFAASAYDMERAALDEQIAWERQYYSEPTAEEIQEFYDEQRADAAFYEQGRRREQLEAELGGLTSWKDSQFYDAFIGPGASYVLSKNRAKTLGKWDPKYGPHGEWDSQPQGVKRIKGGKTVKGKKKVAHAASEVPQYYFKDLWAPKGTPADQLYFPSDLGHLAYNQSDQLGNRQPIEGTTSPDAAGFWAAFVYAVDQDQRRIEIENELEEMEREAGLEKVSPTFSIAPKGAGLEEIRANADKQAEQEHQERILPETPFGDQPYNRVAEYYDIETHDPARRSWRPAGIGYAGYQYTRHDFAGQAIDPNSVGGYAFMPRRHEYFVKLQEQFEKEAPVRDDRVAQKIGGQWVFPPNKITHEDYEEWFQQKIRDGEVPILRTVPFKFTSLADSLQAMGGVMTRAEAKRAGLTQAQLDREYGNVIPVDQIPPHLRSIIFGEARFAESLASEATDKRALESRGTSTRAKTKRLPSEIAAELSNPESPFFPRNKVIPELLGRIEKNMAYVWKDRGVNQEQELDIRARRDNNTQDKPETYDPIFEKAVDQWGEKTETPGAYEFWDAIRYRMPEAFIAFPRSPKARPKDKGGPRSDFRYEPLYGKTSQAQTEQGELTFSIAPSRMTPGDSTRVIVTQEQTLVGPATFAIAGYHGTRHKIPKFEMDKVGQGIGAQVWGYGLYFGGARDIGEDYAQMMANQHSPYAVSFRKGQEIPTVPPSPLLPDNTYDVGPNWFVKDTRTDERVTDYMTVDEADEAFDRLSLEAMNQYKVELDVEPEQLLFADTPFSQQSEFVQETLRKIIPAWTRFLPEGQGIVVDGSTWEDRSHVYPFDDEHVKTLLQLTYDEEMDSYKMPDGTYVNITQWAQSKGMIARKVSEALLSAGIKGIAYEEGTAARALDRAMMRRRKSMRSGQGHPLYDPGAAERWQDLPDAQSYVIFDENDIKILEENGKPIALENHQVTYAVAPRHTPPPGAEVNQVELKKKGKPTKIGPLPTWTVPKDTKQSLGKKILAANHAKDGIPGKALFDRLDLAREMVADDPGRLASPTGWMETMQAAGVWGNILVPPGLMKTIVERPGQYVGLLEGGYHENQTKPGVYQAARDGLNWTKKMGRELNKTGAVPEWNTVLHHFWGLLSRRATPVQQEAMWLRMLTHRPILDSIQRSINGTFSAWAVEQFKTNRKELLKKTRQMRTNDKGKVRPLDERDAWIALVIDAREATADGSALPGGAPMGNNVTSNANDFFAMLTFWDGRWGEVSDVYWTNDSIEMGRRFHSLGDDAVGIQNKVQRFVGLTYGIPGLIMDRWKFVEFWLPDLMKEMRVRKPKNFFKYGKTEASRATPEDPSSLYGFYSLIESQSPVFSLAFYEMMETGLEVAIDNSPELKRFLGPNANVGGLHWHGWNAIKNEAVGHSSLDLSLDLLKNYGLKSNAAAVEKTIKAGNYYTETQKADGTVERFTISKGVPSATRQERVPDGPRDRALGRRRDAKGPGRGNRKDQETFAIGPVFASGLSKGPTDIREAIKQGKPVGIAATYGIPLPGPGGVTETGKPAFQREPSDTIRTLLRDYLNKGGQVFIDSGAFTDFRAGRMTDFVGVFQTYERFSEGVDPGNLENLYVVAPDVIGNPGETELLQMDFIKESAALADKGAQIIVPVQTGQGSLVETVLRSFSSLQEYWPSKEWWSAPIVGVAYEEKSWGKEEVVDFIKAYEGIGVDEDTHADLHEIFSAPPTIHLLGGGSAKVQDIEDTVGGTEVTIQGDSLFKGASRRKSTRAKRPEQGELSFAIVPAEMVEAHRQAEANMDEEEGQRLVDEAAAMSPFTMPVWHGSGMHSFEGPPSHPGASKQRGDAPSGWNLSPSAKGEFSDDRRFFRMRQMETGRAGAIYFTMDPRHHAFSRAFGDVRKYFINPGRVADLTRETNSPEFQQLLENYNKHYEKAGFQIAPRPEEKGFVGYTKENAPPSWELFDDLEAGAADFLMNGDYDAFILEERLAGKLPPSLWENRGITDTIKSIAILDPSRVKSGEPFTYEWEPNNPMETKTLVPLDERFDPNIPDVSYAISPAEGFDPLLEAITDKINDSAEGVVEFLEKIRDRVAEIKAQYESDRASILVSESYDEGGAEIDFEGGVKTGDLDLRAALAYLGAIQKVLPREIQGFVGTAQRLADFKTMDAMSKELARRIPRIEAALENYLARSHRKSIRKILKKGAAKVSNSRKATGKIGPAGHAIFKEARLAMRLQLTEDEKRADRTLQEKGEEMAQSLLDQIEDNDSLDLDEVDELDGRAAAWLLFTDFQNANSERLRKGLDLLSDTYSEGREKWLRVLGARKAQREARLQAIEKLIKDKTRAGRAASIRADEHALKRISEGFMSAFTSGSQMVRRLGETTNDEDIKAMLEEMEEALAAAEDQETDLDYQDNEAFAEALYRILGVKYEHQLSRKIKKHSTAPDSEVPVTSLEGRKTRKYSISKLEAERIANGEATGFTGKGEWIELTLGMRHAIEEAWENFEELTEEEQSGKRVLKFEVVEATGSRRSLGLRTDLELLNLWLTMRQPDQAEKLHRLGYDQTTQRELEAYLPAEVIALGEWMAEYLRQDQETIDRLHRAEKGIGMNLVENYWPVRNDVSGQDYDDLQLDGNQKQSGRSVSFTMQRVTNNAEPAIADALGVFLAHRSQVNFYKAHVATLREWGGLVRHERFSNAVRRSLGDTFYGALSHRMERIQNGGVMKAGRALLFDRLVKGLKKRTSLGILGWRLSTIMVNFTAALNSFLEIPARELLKGLLLASKRPGAWKEAWNSPGIRRRLRDGATYEAQIAKARGPQRRPIISQLEKTAEKGITPINYADVGANMLGAVAVYEYTRTKSLEAGATEEQAKQEGEKAVDRLMARAAQPAQRFTRSEMEHRALENPLAALFALFVSEPRKNLSVAILSARQLATGKGIYDSKAMAAQAFATSSFFLLALEHIIRLSYQAVFRADEDDEEKVLDRVIEKLTDGKAWAHRLAANHAAGIPIYGPAYEWVVGSLVNSSAIPGEDVYQFTNTENPAVRAVEKLGRGTKKFIDAQDEDSKEESLDATIDMIQAGGNLIPGGPLFAQLANVGEATLGFTSSNLTDEGRRARFKGRFNKYKKSLTELLGPTTNKETGETDKDIQQQKWDAQTAYLLEALAPLETDQIIELTQELSISKAVREEIEFGLLNGLDTTTIEDE